MADIIKKRPWNYGKKTGIVPRSAFKKGIVSWNKGRHILRVKREERTCACGCLETFVCKVTSKQRFIHNHHQKLQVVSEATKKKISLSGTGHITSPATRKKIGTANKGRLPWCAGKTKYTHPSLMIISKKNEVSIARMWDDLRKNGLAIKRIEHAKSRMLSACCKRPNKFETNALNYLNVIYKNKFIYTGNGSKMVNGRSADAYSKKLNTIALFHGVYWHLKIKGLKITERNKRSVEKVDSLPFTTAGYKVIFIWEDEMNHILDSLRKKVTHG